MGHWTVLDGGCRVGRLPAFSRRVRRCLALFFVGTGRFFVFFQESVKAGRHEAGIAGIAGRRPDSGSMQKRIIRQRGMPPDIDLSGTVERSCNTVSAGCFGHIQTNAPRLVLPRFFRESGNTESIDNSWIEPKEPGLEHAAFRRFHSAADSL